MAWIDVNERMPEIGQVVPVRGHHIPAGTGNPIAYRRDVFGNGKALWCSTEWRGTVGITHWWEEEKKKRRKRR